MIGRFNSIDPLAEKRPWESTYSYCGNNPVRNIDPTGLKWADIKAAMNLQEQIRRQISDLKHKMTNNKAWLASGSMSDKQKNKISAQNNDLSSRISNMEISIKDIDRLGDDEHTYAFDNKKRNVHGVNLKSDGIVYIENSGDDATSIHEITHVRQSLDAGGLVFNGKGELLNSGEKNKDKADNEVKAYQMGYSFNPSSFPGDATTINDINIISIGNLTRPGTDEWMYGYMRQLIK